MPAASQASLQYEPASPPPPATDTSPNASANANLNVNLNANPVQPAEVVNSVCGTELQNAVAFYNRGNSKQAEIVLEKMTQNCGLLPQLHHNLGVIAAQKQDWQRAETHFKQAIAADTRTNMTQRSLQSIHEYKATAAYREALGLRANLAPPNFEMQSTASANASPQFDVRSGQHNVSAVDYELYAWWQAAASNNLPEWLDHYLSGYPPPDEKIAHQQASAVAWQNVSRRISFTAKDAVVLLNFQVNDIERHAVLLLRLQNNRWKIFQETVL